MPLINGLNRSHETFEPPPQQLLAPTGLACWHPIFVQSEYEENVPTTKLKLKKYKYHN